MDGVGSGWGSGIGSGERGGMGSCAVAWAGLCWTRPHGLGYVLTHSIAGKYYAHSSTLHVSTISRQSTMCCQTISHHPQCTSQLQQYTLLKSGSMSLADQIFPMLDINSDGVISKDEIASLPVQE